MNEDRIAILLDEISKILALLLKRNSNSAVAMKELYAVGLQPKRIAELIGTTSGTVRVGVHQAKKLKNN